jgi:hypothetical protein
MSKNPLGYIDFRSLNSSQGDSTRHECDGMCEKCPKAGICIFSRAEKIPGSGYRNGGDEKFNSKMLDAMSFTSRYSSRGEGGFSSPLRDYLSIGSDYSNRGLDYSSSRGTYPGNSSSGFHGSYEGGECSGCGK